MDLDKFEFYDIWLLLSIGFSEKGSSLKSILMSGNILNHSYFSLEELNFGMSKLIFNGYVETVGKHETKYKGTKKGMDFRLQHFIENEGCIEELLRLSTFFVKLPAKADCSYIAYFSETEYFESIPKNLISNHILKFFKH